MYCLYCFTTKQRKSKTPKKVKKKTSTSLGIRNLALRPPVLPSATPKYCLFASLPRERRWQKKMSSSLTGGDFSGNPPSLGALGSHQDISRIAELLSNSTFITSLSEAVAKQISVSSNFESSSAGSLTGSTNEKDPSKPSGHQNRLLTPVKPPDQQKARPRKANMLPKKLTQMQATRSLVFRNLHPLQLMSRI